MDNEKGRGRVSYLFDKLIFSQLTLQSFHALHRRCVFCVTRIVFKRNTKCEKAGNVLESNCRRTTKSDGLTFLNVLNFVRHLFNPILHV